MPHRNDGFWISVFRKSPLIATSMAICGILAGTYGGYHFVQLARFLRQYLCVITGCTLAGIFVGLIIGVALDTLIGSFRKDEKKKRRNRW
jgi:ABC-type spermidine/putrescine transport system permease subunit II